MGLFSSLGSIIGAVAAPFTGGASLIPSLVSAGASLIGSSMTNDANAASVQQQMAFQADQSGTAYQRAVADMKAAGLNPALMFGSGSAASTPSGSTFQAQNGIQNALNTALSVSQMKAQIQNLDANTSKADADAGLSRVLQAKAAADTATSLSTARVAANNAAISDATNPLNKLADTKSAEFRASGAGQFFERVGDMMRDLNPFMSGANSAKSLTH